MTPNAATSAAAHGPTIRTAAMWTPVEKLKLWASPGSGERLSLEIWMSSVSTTAAPRRARVACGAPAALTTATARTAVPAVTVPITRLRAFSWTRVMSSMLGQRIELAPLLAGACGQQKCSEKSVPKSHRVDAPHIHFLLVGILREAWAPLPCLESPGEGS